MEVFTEYKIRRESKKTCAEDIKGPAEEAMTLT